MPASSALERDLGSFLPRESIVVEGRSAYLADETEGRGILGRAEAVVVPSSTEEVCKVLAWCYDHEVPVVPRGGGTGFAGGAVPLDGGVVLGLERLTRIRSFDPLLWRICVEAGLRTADLRRTARENGLVFPPDPGAAEQSQIGGNIATNERVLGNGLLVAALEYLDGASLEATGAAFPAERPRGAAFLVIAEADGSKEEAESLSKDLVEVLGEGALAVHAPTEPTAIAELWRWRDGVSIAVSASRGGKVSEDIVVPLDRLGEAIEETLAIGRRHGLPACSWGHAGDGNLHSTFLVPPADEEELARAKSAAEELFALAVRLGGSISGEHGVGIVKRGQLARQWSTRALELHGEIKRTFDPKGLLNPGKKVARVGSGPER